MKMTKDTEEKIQQLTMLEQNLQNITVQKQNFQIQLLEIESALKELEGTKEAFKIVANIMIKGDKPELKKELEEKKETIELRISSFEKQEAKLKQKASALQDEVLGKIKNGQSD